MRRLGKTAFVITALLGLELVREWYVLRALGFEPGLFVDWLKGGQDA